MATELAIVRIFGGTCVSMYPVITGTVTPPKKSSSIILRLTARNLVVKMDMKAKQAAITKHVKKMIGVFLP